MFNPFLEKPMKIEDSFRDWNDLYRKPYHKNEAQPYSKVRLILMTGTEYEANWFTHQFARHCDNNDIRRELALIRRAEQQQQKRLSYLKPMDENQLETTIGYEQLAVDLTAIMAQKEKDPIVKAALDFALLEDFDHLYRYADLLDMEFGIHAERLVGQYTEITPGRPTIAEHRFPYDDVRRHICAKTADPLTKLNTMIITAAEQQTMNYYMNLGAFYTSDLGRKLFMEIAMIEEQHVTQYESLMDPTCTWLENLLMHEYCECYLYYSCLCDEKDPTFKNVYELHLAMELGHLHKAADMLKKYEKKEWQQVIPDGAFPSLLNFRSNIDYIRKVLGETVRNTGHREEIVPLNSIAKDAEFFCYNNTVNGETEAVASHAVIQKYQTMYGSDYRFETAPNPVEALQDRMCDNTDIARKQNA